MTDDDRPPQQEARGSRRTLIALLAVVAAVVVIALIAVFARGGTPQFADGTPEGVVQRYSQAVIDGDVPTALSHLVPEVADECTRLPATTDDLRITLLETTQRDDTARVTVIVTTMYDSGPLGTNEFQSEEFFDLEQVDGTWRIAQVPWQLAVCEDSWF